MRRDNGRCSQSRSCRIEIMNYCRGGRNCRAWGGRGMENGSEGGAGAKEGDVLELTGCWRPRSSGT